MEFSGTVIKGKGAAASFGVPTINIGAENISGIFAARVKLCGKTYDAVAYGDKRRELLEAHLFGYEGDAVGKYARIKLLKKLREDATFTDKESLHTQIEKDVESAKVYFAAISPQTRVMVFGTFDGVHEGHRDLFRQARALARDPYLIVSVARDANVRRIKKRAPKQDEQARVAALEKEMMVDEVVLGDTEGYITHVLKANPSVIALGYDQEGEYVDTLQMYLAAGNLSVSIHRCDSYHPEVYKSSKIG